MRIILNRSLAPALHNTYYVTAARQRNIKQGNDLGQRRVRSLTRIVPNSQVAASQVCRSDTMPPCLGAPPRGGSRSGPTHLCPRKIFRKNTRKIETTSTDFQCNGGPVV
jgi:hypothetical protein